jgi:hypothetical protein
MPRRPNPVPTYRLHRQSGQAIVTVRDAAGRRRDMLLGRFGSPESRAEYARVVAEAHSAAGRLTPAAPPPADLTVSEMLLAFWKHAERHYRHDDGSHTSELAEYRYSLRLLRELYGHSPARAFGPLKLKAIRERMIEAGWCRTLINQRVGRVTGTTNLFTGWFKPPGGTW